MTQPEGLTISFLDVDAAVSNDLAGDLEDFLTVDLPTATVERRREDPLTQDFGATLVILLGTSAVTALAQGVSAWLARRQDAHLQLRRVTPDGQVREVTIDGQVGSRAQRIVTDLFAD